MKNSIAVTAAFTFSSEIALLIARLTPPIHEADTPLTFPGNFSLLIKSKLPKLSQALAKIKFPFLMYSSNF